MYQQKILYQPRRMLKVFPLVASLTLVHGIASWLKATQVGCRNLAGAGQASLHYDALLALLALLFS